MPEFVIDDDEPPPSDDDIVSYFCFVANTARNGISLFFNTVLLFILPTDTPDLLLVVDD
jgi:hypothetical protein